jgi:uncharacterized protein YbaP (TraB family)
MTLRAAITLAFYAFFVTVASVSAETCPSQGQPKESHAAPIHASLTKPVYEEVTKLVRTYFPNAKISQATGKLHFEFKAAPHISTSTNLPVIGPKEGGILGDVEVKRGNSGTAPKSINEYYYQTVTMAPYSASHDCYLNVKMSYPPETASDFVDKFKILVNDFESFLPPPPKPVAAETPKPKDAASAVGASSSTTSASTASTITQDPSNGAKPIASAVALATAATVPASKPAAAPRKLFFWKARKGPDIVYLLGTIHAAPPSLYPLPREIEAAFNESKCLIVEVDISKRKVDPAKVHQLVDTSGKYTPPDKLSKHLSPGTKRVFEAYLEWAGESWAMYEQYKPWYARELITASVPRRGDLSKLRKALGIDLHFLAKALSNKTPVAEFETVEFQLALDSKLAPDVQDKLLQVSLLEMKDTDTFMATIFDAWKSGDTEKMERTAVKNSVDNPELIPFTMALLNNRNVGMAAKIEPFLKTKGSPLFVAVGSAHMVGDTGLPNLLKKQGFEVEQLTAAPEERHSGR